MTFGLLLCCPVLALVVLLFSTCARSGQPSSAFDPADSGVLEPPLADISLRRAASPAGIVSAEKPPAGCGPEQAQTCNFLHASAIQPKALPPLHSSPRCTSPDHAEQVASLFVARLSASLQG